MDDAIYFPVLRAKPGEIEAIGWLSPFAEVRTRPLLDVPLPRSGTALRDHLAAIVSMTVDSWGTRLPLYFDFSRYGPEAKIGDRHAAAFLFRLAIQCGLKAIPVGGPPAIRGPEPDYSEAIKGIHTASGLGAAIRLPHDFVFDADQLPHAVNESLSAIDIAPSQVDLFLDAGPLEILPREQRLAPALVLAYRNALDALRDFNLRNLILCASSIPNKVPLSRNWKPLRVARIENEVWLGLKPQKGIARPKFSDYAVTFANQTEPGGPVIAPSRVRLTSGGEHFLFKTRPQSHRVLCRQVLAHDAYAAQPASWGKYAVRDCAERPDKFGNATSWVARDTNMHIESMARIVDDVMRADESYASIQLAREVEKPWLQESLLEPRR